MSDGSDFKFCPICGGKLTDSTDSNFFGSHKCDEKKLARIDALHKSTDWDDYREERKTRDQRLRDGMRTLHESDGTIND